MVIDCSPEIAKLALLLLCLVLVVYFGRVEK